MMLQPKTKVFLISLLVLDIFAVTVFGVLYSFTKSQISDTVNKSEQIRSEIKGVEELSLIKKDIEDSRIYTQKLNGYFIGANDVADFLKILEGLVATSSLESSIQSIGYESPNHTGNVNTELLRIKLNVTGKWVNIQYFLKLLENYPLKIDIKNLALNKLSDNIIGGKKIPQWLGTIDFTAVKLKNI